MGDERNCRIAMITAGKASGISMPVFRMNARHCVCLDGSPDKSVSKIFTRLGSSRVARRSNVARIACPRVPAANGNVRARNQISKKVFHSAVGHPKADDRLKLLGNDAVHRICLNPRCGHRQQGRIIKQTGAHGVTESHIYLNGYPDVLKVGEEFDADAFILLLLLDLRGACRFCRKYDAIPRWSPENRPMVVTPKAANEK